jgi:predicted TIM-barrel fold metal-dependent hydrolase
LAILNSTSAGKEGVVEAIIDCDIHPLVRGGPATLERYLSTAERARRSDSGVGSQHGSTARPINRYMNPSPGLIKGALRADAAPPTGEAPGTDPQFVVEDLLDRFGARAALMIPIPYGVWLDPRNAGPLVSAMNQYFIDEWLSVDPRFRLNACVFPVDVEEAAAEIRKRAADPRVAGIFMPLISTLMGDVHYDPIYRAAAENGLPIVIHPTGAEGTYPIAPPLAGGVPSTYTERHIGLCQVAAANVISLVGGGTFDRFPDLKVVFAEYGYTWAAPLMWRMDHEASRLATGLERHPIEYMIENIRYCSQPVEEPTRPREMVQMVEMMGGDQTLMFSTDYPHWDTDNPSSILGNLKGELRNRVFYENARETFAGRL